MLDDVGQDNNIEPGLEMERPHVAEQTLIVHREAFRLAHAFW